MDVLDHNRQAWNRQVEKGNPWTIPVDSDTIADARQGKWELYLTPIRPLPREWLPSVKGLDVLCLASGGGQQGPVLAAAGARVTVLDNSPKQLERDHEVAAREGLQLAAVEGDMANLAIFAGGTFDLIVNPVSNVFAPDVQPVWREAYRVLRRSGVLIAAFDNPIVHMVDEEEWERSRKIVVKHALPYSDAVTLSDAEKRRFLEEGIPMEFGHTLEAQIGGQCKAGFVITGMYEDGDRPEDRPAADGVQPGVYRDASGEELATIK
ncbi:MAG: class I SAM-dependent methyltransferase [Anaerolineales bacterium]